MLATRLRTFRTKQILLKYDHVTHKHTLAHAALDTYFTLYFIHYNTVTLYTPVATSTERDV